MLGSVGWLVVVVVSEVVIALLVVVEISANVVILTRVSVVAVHGSWFKIGIINVATEKGAHRVDRICSDGELI